MDTKNRKIVLLYVVKRLSEQLERPYFEGRKKLMKIMFLVEHFNPQKKTLHKNNLLGNKFVICHYGPFSFDVRDSFDGLKKEGMVIEEPYMIPYKIGISNVGIKYLSENEKHIPKEIKERIEKIIDQFGLKDGNTLEKQSLKLLKISSEDKKELWGEDIKDLVRC